MKLMIVSNPINFTGEIKLINRLFDSGLEVLHFRKPEAGKKECYNILNGIDAQYHNRIALHQFHELGFDFGIHRFHFPEKLRKETTENSLSEFSVDKILSTSIHQIKEIEHLHNFDYTFLGPVFDSYSKNGYKGMTCNGFTSDQGSKNSVKKNTKVIALGGIGLNTIGRMKRMGFDGAAMLGWIWNDPLKSIDNFKQIKCWVTDHM